MFLALFLGSWVLNSIYSEVTEYSWKNQNGDGDPRSSADNQMWLLSFGLQTLKNRFSPRFFIFNCFLGDKCAKILMEDSLVIITIAICFTLCCGVYLHFIQPLFIKYSLNMHGAALYFQNIAHSLPTLQRWIFLIMPISQFEYARPKDKLVTEPKSGTCPSGTRVMLL